MHVDKLNATYEIRAHLIHQKHVHPTANIHSADLTNLHVTHVDIINWTYHSRSHLNTSNISSHPAGIPLANSRKSCIENVTTAHINGSRGTNLSGNLYVHNYSSGGTNLAGRKRMNQKGTSMLRVDKDVTG
jgi:hypothetical protein